MPCTEKHTVRVSRFGKLTCCWSGFGAHVHNQQTHHGFGKALVHQVRQPVLVVHDHSLGWATTFEAVSYIIARNIFTCSLCMAPMKHHAINMKPPGMGFQVAWVLYSHECNPYTCMCSHGMNTPMHMNATHALCSHDMNASHACNYVCKAAPAMATALGFQPPW